MGDDVYDDPIKQVCWRTFWAGYKAGYSVEDYKPITKRTARSSFERWWRRNA